MSYPINGNHSEVLPTKSRYEKENYQVNIGTIYASSWNIAKWNIEKFLRNCTIKVEFKTF
jgi:hypothetical protein